MRNILIIEDDKLLVRTLAEKFSDAGFKVAIAYDGKEGLDYLSSNTPDFILLDVVMPIMDGLSLLKQIKLEEKTKYIPIIVLSNITNDSTLKQIEEFDVGRVWIKGQRSLDELIDEVKKQLSV